MDFFNFILENRLHLIPVLWIIGEMVKGMALMPNKYIPALLGLIGIVLSIMINGTTTVESVTQGILVAGATVYGHQFIKQKKKGD